MVSFFDFSSRATHSSVKDSRPIPFNDCVTMFGAEVGGNDGAVGGGAVAAGKVGDTETDEPSRIGPVGAGINTGAEDIEAGDESSVGGTNAVGVGVLDDIDELVDELIDELDDVGLVLGEVGLVLADGGVVLATASAGSGASTFRLRSSVDPPHAETRRSAASTRVDRFEFIFETLFRITSKFSSAPA